MPAAAANCPQRCSTKSYPAWTIGGIREPVIGNDTKDDAAVVDLGDGTGIISTTDFFMPIVDDPCTFGRIAGQCHQ